MKKDKSVRITVDNSYVNSYCTADPFLVPSVKEVKLKVGRFKYITVTNAKSGYWQIPVRRKDQWLTGFISHWGFFKLVWAPIELKNSGSTFVRVMKIILNPLKDFIDSYLDKVAVYSDTQLRQVEPLNRYFDAISNSGLTLNLKKCQFAKSSIWYMEHILGSDHHGLDPSKVEVVTELEPPTTKNQVHHIMGPAISRAS